MASHCPIPQIPHTPSLSASANLPSLLFHHWHPHALGSGHSKHSLLNSTCPPHLQAFHVLSPVPRTPLPPLQLAYSSSTRTKTTSSQEALPDHLSSPPDGAMCTCCELPLCPALPLSQRWLASLSVLGLMSSPRTMNSVWERTSPTLVGTILPALGTMPSTQQMLNKRMYIFDLDHMLSKGKFFFLFSRSPSNMCGSDPDTSGATLYSLSAFLFCKVG